jgi:hypothetical protein
MVYALLIATYLLGSSDDAGAVKTATWLTLGTLIVTEVTRLYRESRHHKWEIEEKNRQDAARDRAERERREIKETMDSVHEQAKTAVSKVEENTAITKGGIDEAVSTAAAAKEKAEAARQELAGLRAQFDELKEQALKKIQ